MIRTVVILTAALLALGAGAASAQPAATWNSGYNGWWPGGFGYPPVTGQAAGYPCSVTAYGPTFHSYPREWRMDYGAGTSCQGGVGAKTLTVLTQVLGQDGHTWYTITGSAVTYGPRTINPLPGSSATVPPTSGTSTARSRRQSSSCRTGCRLFASNTCNQTIVIRAISRPLAP